MIDIHYQRKNLISLFWCSVRNRNSIGKWYVPFWVNLIRWIFPFTFSSFSLGGRVKRRNRIFPSFSQNSEKMDISFSIQSPPVDISINLPFLALLSKDETISYIEYATGMLTFFR